MTPLDRTVIIRRPGEPCTDAEAIAAQIVSAYRDEMMRQLIKRTEWHATSCLIMSLQLNMLDLMRLDRAAGDKLIDAMRRNVGAALDGDRSGVALEELHDAAQTCCDAFDLQTAKQTGPAS